MWLTSTANKCELHEIIGVNGSEPQTRERAVWGRERDRRDRKESNETQKMASANNISKFLND